MKTALNLIKNNAVFLIAITLATITAFIIPPDEKYISYFDFSTLCCLLGTLAVVEALSDVRFFEILARKIVQKFKNMRAVTFALVFITYFGSMVMANDMALITFLPLGYFVLTKTNKREKTAFVFIMQNIAANLGGMLTPFGNPQNLYLYSKYSIPTGEFMLIMLAPFIAAFLGIVACCFFVKPEPVEIADDPTLKVDKVRTAIYLILFAVSVASVLRIFPYYIGIAVALVGIAVLDAKAFKHVNYGLILTFCAFFVFSGNMARIEWVNRVIGGLLSKNTLFFSVLSCQVISNVPSATLLCRFTDNYRALLRGVNIGGLGTPIASLASLITLSSYKSGGEKVGKYLALFSAINFGFLAVLYAVCVCF